MISALRRYKKAEAELKAAEKALNEAVDPYLKKAHESEHKMMHLISLMPKTYPGVRRMYEAVLRMAGE